MEYLHKFNNQNEFNDYVNLKYDEPFVAVTKDGNQQETVDYNLDDEHKRDILEQPLTFVVTKAGRIFWACSENVYTKTIQYSKDNGTTWSSITSTEGQTYIDVDAGDVVIFKGDNETYAGTILTYNSFSGSTCEFYVRGNIMSLINSISYSSMTSLDTNYTFFSLFEDCTGLTDASNLVLPATILSDYCYSNMFYNCVNLGNIEKEDIVGLYRQVDVKEKISVPSLPSSTLSVGCYSGMFTNCQHIKIAPELNAVTLLENCYMRMFSGCTSLSHITMKAVDISATSALTNWTSNVAAEGVFIKSSSNTTILIDSPNGVPSGWTLTDAIDDILTFDIVVGGTIIWKSVDCPKTIQYSLDDGEHWTTITSSESGAVINVNAGDKIQFKGSETGYGNTSDRSKYSTFDGSTAVFNVYGNIMSLVGGVKMLTSAYTFRRLFYETNVVNAGGLVLPATALTKGCYSGMFSKTTINAAPELPATELAEDCYFYMFELCSSLQTAPELPASNAHYTQCYTGMFSNCSSLNYIKCLATSVTDQSSWVASVSLTGLFIKAPTMSGWTVGSGGIPSGWTIIDSTEDLYIIRGKSQRFAAMEDNRISQIYSNTDYEISSKPSWITINKTNMGDGLTMLNLVTEQNTGTTERIGTVVLRTIDSAKTETISCTQVGENAFEGQYLTFDVLSAGTLYWKTDSNAAPKTVEYRKNGGAWSSITSTESGVPIALNDGDLVEVRGDNTTYTVDNGTNYLTSFFTGDIVCNIYGNIMSMIDSVYFLTLTTFSGECPLRKMFTGLPVEDASNLLLPATGLTTYAYQRMFRNCTRLTNGPKLPATTITAHCYEAMFEGCALLTTAPDLPALTLPTYSYNNMFSGCTSLNYIKCLATNKSASYSTSNWVAGVPNTGTFVKNQNMTSWPTGAQGIPSGWTVVDDV